MWISSSFSFYTREKSIWFFSYQNHSSMLDMYNFPTLHTIWCLYNLYFHQFILLFICSNFTLFGRFLLFQSWNFNICFIYEMIFRWRIYIEKICTIYGSNSHVNSNLWISYWFIWRSIICTIKIDDVIRNIQATNSIMLE